MSHNKQRADLVFGGTVTNMQQLDNRHSLVTLNVEKECKGPRGRYHAFEANGLKARSENPKFRHE